MAASLKLAIPLARREPTRRFSLEKIFDYVIAGLAASKNASTSRSYDPIHDTEFLG